MKKTNLLFLFVLVVLTFSTISAQFTSVQGGGKWWYPSTWSTDPNATAIPDSTDDVIVNHEINIDGSGSCYNLTINSGGRIHNGSVAVYGSLFNNGTINGRDEWYGMKIRLKGNLTNYSKYDADTDFNGILDQTVFSEDTLRLGQSNDYYASSKIIFNQPILISDTWLFLRGSELEFNDTLKIINTTLDGGVYNGKGNVLLGIGYKNSLGWTGAVSFNPSYTELKNIVFEGIHYIYGNGNVGEIYALGIGENNVNNGTITNTYQHTGGSAKIHILKDFINNGLIQDQQDGLYINVNNSNFINNGEMINRNITFQNSSIFTNNSDSLGVLELKGVDENSIVTINKDLLFTEDVMINMNGGKMILSDSAVLDGFGMENTILEANGSVISTRSNSHISLSSISDIKAKRVLIAYYTNLFGEIEIIEDGLLSFLNSRGGNIKGNIENNGTVTGRIDSTIIGNITNNSIWKANTLLKGEFKNNGEVARQINVKIEGTVTNNSAWKAETEVVGNVVNEGIIDTAYKFNVEGEITNLETFNPLGSVELIGNINNSGIIGGGSFRITGNINNAGSWSSYQTELFGTNDQYISMPSDSLISATYRILFDAVLDGINYQWYRNDEKIEGENSRYLSIFSPGLLPDNATYNCKVDSLFSRNIIIQSLTNIEDEEEIITKNTIPKEYLLSQNYPNPFNPSTVIEYALPEKANVILKVYNTVGEEVATLINNEIVAGYHSVNFNANQLSSGIYFYRIITNNFTKTNKMMLLR